MVQLLPARNNAPRGSVPAIVHFFHFSRLLVALFAAGLLGGCSTGLPFLRDGAPPPAAMAAAEDVTVLEVDPLPLAELDLSELAVPQDRILPVGPDGTASLEDLEGLYATALDLCAEGRTEPARDHLFTLQDHLDLPEPADADSLYLAHRASLGRRLWLLSGILAEQDAFAAGPAAADSLLAAEYGRLAQVSFPDSLVPATGTDLSPITADLLEQDNQAVAKWVAYFTGRGRGNFQFWLDRKARVDSLITSILVEEGLPRELIYLAMIESGMSPRAVSSASAVGPWQFMAGTGKTFGLRRNWWLDERRDMELSTRAAARYLQRLYGQFGDWALVLAGYNSGENRVVRRIRQHGHDNFWSLRLPRQTTDYIPKYIAAARIGENPEKYGFVRNPAKQLQYDILKVDDATDLDLIARCAGCPPEAVAELNPALLRGASPAGMKDYPVRVPSGTGARAARELKRIPADRRLTWRRHKVQRGETLGHIGRRYGTSVDDIAKLNKLGNVHLIRPGNQLLIPMPAELARQASLRAAEKGHYVPPDGWQRVSYQVKSGDTLGAIARRLHVTVRHLQRVNGLRKSALIFPGQRLYAYRPGS